ncbi:hypothetical protein A2Y85_02660 [candidate division WOR-3 bacterium RBG_13_43_14]|uniref:Secretion system C-terminal sorting domain-containing protein n=1 Tax=candidate division WOR-3 bacterium RBG_13_43_14 TaxID=1802590 RepID=A0A1F4UBW0_UNCW3|nr:MAG: hypothetical protein A2Y85_02660 [candidate division WOR-3 bacterium RBG_13_43_14]
MRNIIVLLHAVFLISYADAPWVSNVRVSADVPWDTLNQGESCFAVYGDTIVSICNTAERGSVPIAPYAYSFDGGSSFTQIPFTDSTTGIIWHTDPVIGVDDSGYVHMLIQFSTSRLKHYMSRDGGQHWHDTSTVWSAGGVDKPWMVVNHNEIYIAWQQVSGSYGIRFAKSTDYGNTWSSSIIWSRTGITALAMDESEVLHLGLVDGWPTGDIYYRQSTNYGTTWSSEVYLSNSYYNTGYGDRAPINSITARSGNVFLTWVDSRTGNWDIYAVRSTNNGTTWSSRFIVNDITTGGQCKGWSTFDAYGGLHVIYYHTPDWPTGPTSPFSLRYRYSGNAGSTFEPSMRVSDTEAPSHADFIGEYHICVSDSQYLYAIWADGRNAGDNDLYFSKALLSQLSRTEYRPPVIASRRLIEAPSIWRGDIMLMVNADQGPVNINIYDASGRLVMDQVTSVSTVQHHIRISSSKLPAGVLFIWASNAKQSEVIKVINLR